MQEKADIWTDDDADAIVAVLDWLTAGLGETHQQAGEKRLIRWVVWDCEDTGRHRSTLNGDGRRTLRERVQRIGDPKKGGVLWALNALRAGFSAVDALWGIAAVADTGDVYRITLGLPSWWPVAKGSRPAVVPARVEWTDDGELARFVWGPLAG